MQRGQRGGEQRGVGQPVGGHDAHHPGHPARHLRAQARARRAVRALAAHQRDPRQPDAQPDAAHQQGGVPGVRAVEPPRGVGARHGVGGPVHEQGVRRAAVVPGQPDPDPQGPRLHQHRQEGAAVLLGRGVPGADVGGDRHRLHPGARLEHGDGQAGGEAQPRKQGGAAHLERPGSDHRHRYVPTGALAHETPMLPESG